MPRRLDALPATPPPPVRWEIELLAGQECLGCGRTLDRDLLLRRAERIIAQATSKLARLQLCEACASASPHPHRQARQRLLVPLPPPLRELAARRRAEVTTYFRDAPARITSNPRLREPQREAYLAVRRHFAADGTDASRLPAIVEIPTGCGKTGIICTVPFGIATGRVLVITPNLTIKRNLVKALGSLEAGQAPGRDNFFLKCGIFDDASLLPRFVVLERGQVNREDCLRADILVSNIQQIQGWLPHFEPDFFDMIIVDEAHHEPAESWQRVNQAFPAAKKIYLTATPFRCDSKLIVGETIYRYRLAQAISQGYVKNVMKVDAIASRMTFTVQGEVREFSFEEIMAVREELWFSKGVALSELCNQTIVDRSIALWREKRADGVAHQIIAAACSIRHALQIVELYRARGLRTTHVASEGMSFEDRSDRILGYEAGRYDCMVHVGILGEGYDNPNISVAAIFRPYRSLSPYAQFVGRTLRWIAGAAPADNLAHVVSHCGLNLNFLWEYFKHETRDAAVMACLDDLFFSQDAAAPFASDMDDELLELEVEEAGFAPKVTGEVIDGWDVDTFLPLPGLLVEPDAAVLPSREVRLATLNSPSFRAYGRAQDRQGRRRTLHQRTRGRVGDDDFDRRPPRRRRPRAEPSLTLPFSQNRPDLERRDIRLALHREVQRAAGYILFQLAIPTDASLVSVMGQGDERNNYEAAVSSLQRAVNRLLGKEETGSNRNDWTVRELEAARQSVPTARQAVLHEFRRRIRERDQHRLPLEE